jgi:hypothetical protein
MAGIWVHGELAGDGSLAKLSTEVATLARAVAEELGDAEVTGVVIGLIRAGRQRSWRPTSRRFWRSRNRAPAITPRG